MRTAITISSLTAIRMTVKNSVWWMLKGDIDTAHLRRDGQPDNQSLLFGWVGRGSRQDLFYIRFSGKRGAGSNQRSRNTSIRQTRLSYMRALSVLWKYYEIFDLNRRLVYLRILCRISLGDSPYPPIRIVRIGYPVVHPVVDGRYQYLPLAFIKPNSLPSYGSPSTTR